MTNQPSTKSSARDVFSHLLLIAMFVTGVVSFLTLLFQYINLQFPDILDSYWIRNAALDTLRGAISALLISWPVVIFMSWFIGKDLRSDTQKKHIWIRKWLLHLMLFVSSITIIIDLITLINTYLNGELTTRFALKVLSVLIVAVAVFWYYLWELKRDPIKQTRVTVFSAIGSVVVIVIAMVASFFVIGSPAEQRNIRLDQQRISDLQSIQSSLVGYWQDKELLPETLTELEDDLIGYYNPVDPESGDSYGYQVTGDLSFQLCATFLAESSVGNYNPRVVEATLMTGETSWAHESGYVCFDRTIDPDRVKDEYIY